MPLDLAAAQAVDNIARIPAAGLADRDLGAAPVMLTGGCEAWPAMGWGVDGLMERFGADEFAVGDTNSSVPVPLADYVAYARGAVAAADDNPLYLFETLLDEGQGATAVHDAIAAGYTPPIGEELDLLSVAPEGARPGYRWILVGAPRSGSNIHVDPFATSAWNTCLAGHKRWVLFHPETEERWLKPAGAHASAAGWFATALPLVLAACADGAAGGWPARCRPVQCVQRPGETIIVPSGWWHVVLNLDVTIAVTQNYAEARNFGAIRRACFVDLWGGWSRLDSADEWLAAVGRRWPALVAGRAYDCVECGEPTALALTLLGGRRLCRCDGCPTSSHPWSFHNHCGPTPTPTPTCYTRIG